MSSSATKLMPVTSDPASEDVSSAPVDDRVPDSLPRIVTVMCPTGFTPFATEGLTLDKPLFARVTYRRA